MNRLQAIEKSLLSINEAAFQELCDSFLSLRNSNYVAFSRTGSQSGKQKTIKGTPDSFLLLPNGSYIFVEYSTNVTKGVAKLAKDIEKCLDCKKTGIAIEQIAEIVLCANFNLKADEVEQLRTQLKDTGISFSIFTLDRIALELNLNHRDLAHQYLGLPLDTGQIVSMEKFIEEYGRAYNGISTPLDNTFLHRENELSNLTEAISKNDFLILTGASGVGKTKLALEGIKRFLSTHHSFSAYCVSYKSCTLLDDLYQYADEANDYILFVDDANRIDAFSQITGFYRASRKGELKILITVRDYAYKDISLICHEFQPGRIDVEKLADDQIVDIIKAEPFQILNPDYHKPIVHIADGNPRLAIMTALLAKAKQNIYALSDASDLFENYFSTFIKDDGEFADELNIRCLGLISFFHTIPYKEKDTTMRMLNDFGIEYHSFIESIDRLDKLELVEIQFEHVKIPEQNLSTYFFYRVFVKDNLLSFDVLLDKYFDTNTDRFTDCVVPANNTFGHENVMQKLQPQLQNHWKHISGDEKRAFKFLSTFWFYLQYEALAFIFHIAESLPDTPAPLRYEVAYERNAFSFHKNEVLDLLGDFFSFPTMLKDALELSIAYVRKLPEHLPELIHSINTRLSFDREDEWVDFERQNILYEVLLNGIKRRDLLYASLFYELSKTFLSFKFQQTKSGRKMTLVLYSYTLPDSSPIHAFRQNIWEAIKNNFEYYPSLSFELIKTYALVHPDVTQEIMAFDVPFLVNIIEKHLSPTSFEHCKYVQDQIRWCKRSEVSHPKFETFEGNFTNGIYKTFLKIDWDRFRDKESYEVENFKEYDVLKESEIREAFVFNELIEVEDFYETFLWLKNLSDNQYNYNKTLDLVIDENCKRNFAVGCHFFITIIKNDNEAGYCPWIVFKNQLNEVGRSKEIWQLIQCSSFKFKESWEFSFYECLDDSLVNQYYVSALYATTRALKSPYTIRFGQLHHFLKIDALAFQSVLRIIVERNEKEDAKLQIFDELLESQFDELGEDLLLIKAVYLQQDRLQHHFDHQGKAFLNILKKDSRFLIEYIEYCFSLDQSILRAEKRHFETIWEVENVEEVLSEVFDLISLKGPCFGIGSHFCNSFFKNLDGRFKPRAEFFLLKYLKGSFSNSDKVNLVVDIVRNTMTNLFEVVLLDFLSLTQDKEIFSQVWWRGNGGSYSGKVIIGDIQAAEWRNIVAIVEKSDIGVKLIPIKEYLKGNVDASLAYADRERRRRFLERN